MSGVIAFGNQQVDGPVSLHLEDQRTFELDGRRQQRRGCCQLAQQRAHDIRILMALQNALPHGFQMHDLAPDGRALKQEPANGICHFSRRVKDDG